MHVPFSSKALMRRWLAEPDAGLEASPARRRAWLVQEPWKLLVQTYLYGCHVLERRTRDTYSVAQRRTGCQVVYLAFCRSLRLQKDGLGIQLLQKNLERYSQAHASAPFIL